MKNLIAFAIALFVSSTSFAQLTPGSYVVGGGLGFRFTKTQNFSSEIKSTSFSITPGIGKFTSEKYFIEGGIGYNFDARSQVSGSLIDSKVNTHSFSAQFGITRFFPIVDRLYFTLGGRINPAYSVSSVETTSPGVPSMTNSSSLGYRIDVAPGLSYFINRKWMLYTSIGLLYYDFSYNIDNETVRHSLNLNLLSNSFSVGVRYVLGKGTNE